MILHVFSVHPLAGYALEGLSAGSAATVAGTLHEEDGHPIVVHGGGGVVHGTLHAVDPPRREAVLAMADAIHGVAVGHAVRTIAPTSEGLLAFAWHSPAPPRGDPIADGRWRNPEPVLI